MTPEWTVALIIGSNLHGHWCKTGMSYSTSKGGRFFFFQEIGDINHFKLDNYKCDLLLCNRDQVSCDIWLVSDLVQTNSVGHYG